MGVEGWHPLFRNFATVGKFADMSQLLLARTWLSCIKTYPTNALVGQNRLWAPVIDDSPQGTSVQCPA